MTKISTRFALLLAAAAVVPLLGYGAMSVLSLRSGAQQAVIVGNLNVARPIFPRVPKAGSPNAAGFRYCVPGRPDVSRYTFGKTIFGRWLRI